MSEDAGHTERLAAQEVWREVILSKLNEVLESISRLEDHMNQRVTSEVGRLEKENDRLWSAAKELDLNQTKDRQEFSEEITKIKVKFALLTGAGMLGSSGIAAAMKFLM